MTKYKIADMPIALKSKAWVMDSRHFNLTEEEVDRIPTFAEGQYGILLVTDPVLLADLHRHRITQRYNGRSILDLDNDGDRLAALFMKLMMGTLTVRKMSKFAIDMELINQMNLDDFRELQRRYGFEYSAEEIGYALYNYWPQRFTKGNKKDPPKYFFGAVNNLIDIHGQMQPRVGRPRKKRYRSW